ncbi:unnamed protein product [Trichobilharzia regenti]|nr:unnamed protein product [Trichobilharzia regenti]
MKVFRVLQSMTLCSLSFDRYGDPTGLDFGTWMLFALPLSSLFVLFFGPKKLLTFKQSERKKKLIVRRFFVDKNDPKTTNSSAAIFMSISLMIIPAFHPPNTEIIRGRRPWNVTVKRLPWGMIVVTGGGYALAFLVQKEKCLGDHLKDVPVTVLSTVCIHAIAVFTEFMTNLAVVFCEGIGIHFLALSDTVASSFAFVLPIGILPNMIIFAKGRVKVKHAVMAGWITLWCVKLWTLGSSPTGNIFTH